MRNVIILVFIVVLFGLSGQKKINIKVMSYNIRFGELSSLERLADYIHKENPDIVALQEVDYKTNRLEVPSQNGKDFIGELAFYTGMFGIFGKTIDYSNGFYGIGILSKFPIIRSERILLKNCGSTQEDRTLLVTDLEISRECSLIFACTHLDLDSASRKMEMIEIQNYMHKINGLHILAGDMNAKVESGEVKKHFKHWKDTLPFKSTFPSINPKVKIDYILSDDTRRIQVLEAKVDSTVHLSDHLPCIVKLEIKY